MASTTENDDRSTSSSVDSKVFKVERIVASRYISGYGMEYFIKWLGYSSNENTWEPERNIMDRSMITDFMEEKKKEREKKRLDEKNSSNFSKSRDEMHKKQKERIGNVIDSDSSSSSDKESKKTTNQKTGDSNSKKLNSSPNQKTGDSNSKKLNSSTNEKRGDSNLNSSTNEKRGDLNLANKKKDKLKLVTNRKKEFKKLLANQKSSSTGFKKESVAPTTGSSEKNNISKTNESGNKIKVEEKSGSLGLTTWPKSKKIKFGFKQTSQEIQDKKASALSLSGNPLKKLKHGHHKSSSSKHSHHHQSHRESHHDKKRKSSTSTPNTLLEKKVESDDVFKLSYFDLGYTVHSIIGIQRSLNGSISYLVQWTKEKNEENDTKDEKNEKNSHETGIEAQILEKVDENGVKIGQNDENLSKVDANVDENGSKVDKNDENLPKIDENVVKIDESLENMVKNEESDFEVGLVTNFELREKCPQKLIKYYESIIKFSSAVDPPGLSSSDSE